MRTILVPLDGSPLSEQALPYVRLLAPILAANVCLLHVITEVDREGIITSGTLRPYGAAGAVTYGELAPVRGTSCARTLKPISRRWRRC